MGLGQLLGHMLRIHELGIGEQPAVGVAIVDDLSYALLEGVLHVPVLFSGDGV